MKGYVAELVTSCIKFVILFFVLVLFERFAVIPALFQAEAANLCAPTPVVPVELSLDSVVLLSFNIGLTVLIFFMFIEKITSKTESHKVYF